MRSTTIGAALLIAAGAALVGYGLLTPAKAWLSQHLLDHAWQRVLDGEDDVRPWPWMDSEPVARLSFAKAGAEGEDEEPGFVVMRGVSGSTLAFAPGWHEGTARPGSQGTTLISAHRDTHFAMLGKIARHDRLILEDEGGEEHVYEVGETVITSEPTLHLADIGDRPRLLLVTCYPLDAWDPQSRQRLVVVADPV